MTDPTVSVIIPTFNGTDHLVDAIESVLNQTYPDFELIVVNDASPDDTDEVIKQFDDARLKYILHERNLGAVAARKTALNCSRGQYIAFLDQDDLFHPEKLETHVNFMQNRPDVGVTYNGRFDIGHSADTVLRIWQPPSEVGLEDMILGFPFAPSDTVFRREWALREDIWDYVVLHGKEIVVNGGEYVYCGRLWFAGCKFANVGRTLNYRRFHMGRVLTDLDRRCESELACQRIIFDDSRCPADVHALSDIAYSNTYLVYAYYAFAQGEVVIGRDYVAKAYHLTPEIVAGATSNLAEFMIANSIIDEGRNHEATLRAFYVNLPEELGKLAAQQDEAIAHSYLLKGANQLIWGRIDQGRNNLGQAAALGADVSDTFFHNLAYQLLAYEKEFGASAVQVVVDNLTASLKSAFNSRVARRLVGTYLVNQAFADYWSGSYRKVPLRVGAAFANDPKYLANRGVWAIGARSWLSMWGHKKEAAGDQHAKVEEVT